MSIEAMKAALGVLESIGLKTEKMVDAIALLRQALAQPEQEFVGACVTCGAPKGEWLVDAVNMSQERVDETAKREHEPVGYVTIEEFPNQIGVPSIKWFKKLTEGPLYTAPPISDYHEGWEEGFKVAKREWVGLTEADIYEAMDFDDEFDFAHAIEAKLKEKNA